MLSRMLHNRLDCACWAPMYVAWVADLWDTAAVVSFFVYDHACVCLCVCQKRRWRATIAECVYRRRVRSALAAERKHNCSLNWR